MSLEIAITLVLAYLAVGFTRSQLGGEAREREHRVLHLLAKVLLWPALLMRRRVQPHAAPARTNTGLTFARMQGVGILTCGYCEQHYEVLSYTQGDGWSRGYQCQSCGRFEIRAYKEPFARPNPNYFNIATPLAELPAVYRQHRIEHVQSMVRIIENNMRTTPRHEWVSTWESNLAAYRHELEPVADAELAQVKKLRDDADAAFRASLVCACGGMLERENILFCPACKGNNLTYTTPQFS